MKSMKKDKRKNKYENETPEERAKRRRKNRIFNAVLYTISAILILGGVLIILLDQTTIFNVNSAEIPQVTFPPIPTFPPDGVTEEPYTTDPGALEPTPTPTPNPPGVTDPPPTPTPDPALFTPAPTNTDKPNTTHKPTSTHRPVATDDPANDIPNRPVAVYFDGHDISCRVIPVGVDSNGQMASVPRYDVAGWYKFGACPDEEGNCIIAGHNRYGRKGLFSILHDGLAVGDRIIVTLADGRYMFYVVESLTQYLYNEVPDEVMHTWGEQRLTLITCLGDYSHVLHMSMTRVVAVCRPIG